MQNQAAFGDDLVMSLSSAPAQQGGRCGKEHQMALFRSDTHINSTRNPLAQASHMALAREPRKRER